MDATSAPLVWAFLSDSPDLSLLVCHYGSGDTALLTQLLVWVDWRDAPGEVEGWRVTSGPVLHEGDLDALLGDVTAWLRGERTQWNVDDLRGVKLTTSGLECAL